MSPPASCSDAVRQAAENLTALCEDLKDAPLDERLSALAALHHAFGVLHQCAQREAITTAREQGWPLRRIAAALNCSHEQVRLVIAAGDPAGQPGSSKALPSGHLGALPDDRRETAPVHRRASRPRRREPDKRERC